MHIQRYILLASACISVCALPISQLSTASAREVDSSALYDRALDTVYVELLRRVLTPSQLTERVGAVRKAQAQTMAKANEKHSKNTHIKNATPKVKAPGHLPAGKPPKIRAALHQKANDKERDRAVTTAQKKTKEDRKNMWADAKGKPHPKPGAAAGPSRRSAKAKKRLDTAERTQVKGALGNAANRMHHTADVPGNKDKFTVGTHTSTGQEVRKAVMNSQIHENVPIGRGTNKLPKEFRNDKYASTHPTLAGQRAIDNPTGASLKEYPVTKQGQGWLGSGKVGAARVITSSTGGADTFHGVISHDPSQGGDKDDHYKAAHTRT